MASDVKKLDSRLVDTLIAAEPSGWRRIRMVGRAFSFDFWRGNLKGEEIEISVDKNESDDARR